MGFQLDLRQAARQLEQLHAEVTGIFDPVGNWGALSMGTLASRPASWSYFDIVAIFAPQPLLGWDAAPVLDNLPAADVTGSTDDEPTFTLPGRRYFALSQNGWGAMVGWSMGIGNMVRVPDRQEHVTREIVTGREGAITSRSWPRTAVEQAEVDDDIDIYLDAAGIPAQYSHPAGQLRLCDRAGEWVRGPADTSEVKKRTVRQCLKTLNVAEFISAVPDCLSEVPRNCVPQTGNHRPAKDCSK